MRKALLQSLVVILMIVAVGIVIDRSEAQSFSEIDAEQLKERMDAGEELMLLNPLSKIEYDDKHIPGSVNIPLQEILVSDDLPAEKDQLIVTYCLGRK